MNENGNFHCDLIKAKSRVAAIKAVTVPRLELTAAAVSGVANEILQEELGIPGIDEYFWSKLQSCAGVHQQ